MSREIKFRVWNEELEEMYELRKVNYLGSTGIIDSYVGGDKSIWQQYTGLKDKNDVEIYEGDILKTFSNINKYTDSFAEDIEPKFEYTTIVQDGACFKTTYKGRPSYVLNENSGSTVEHMEVVGNIYENKNLLEEK